MEQLSMREREVCALVIQGKSNKEVANILHIAVKTVKFHMTRIFVRMGVKNRAELSHALLSRERPEVKEILAEEFNNARLEYNRHVKQLEMELEATKKDNKALLIGLEAIRKQKTKVQYVEVPSLTRGIS